jgi:phage gpG-like protein
MASGGSGVNIKVTGIDSVSKAFSGAAASSQDMQTVMQDIGNIVIRGASVPSVSGQLQGSITVGRGKTKSVIRAGGARAPYAPVVHYGWSDRNISGQPFLTQSLQNNKSVVEAKIADGINDALKKNNLK